MPLEQPSTGTSLIDVLDRVLDKGIVIDAWVRVSVVGIDLVTLEARVLVASIETYLKYSEVLKPLPAVAAPYFFRFRRARVRCKKNADLTEPGPPIRRQ